MNLSDFPGFPGFLDIASSHPDKVRVQKDRTEFTELNITDQIESMIKNLKYIETLECRAIMSKEIIDDKRKKYTLIFKTLLMAKENQNTK